jgi:hypothetical protein
MLVRLGALPSARLFRSLEPWLAVKIAFLGEPSRAIDCLRT